MSFMRESVFKADQFAVSHNHGQDLKDSLVRIYQRDKAALVADPLYSGLNNTHPTLVERLSAIDGSRKVDTQEYEANRI